MKHEVMMNDNLAIAGRMDVQFDCVGAELESAEKGGNRVFRQIRVRSTVGDFERLAWTGTQSGLVRLG